MQSTDVYINHIATAVPEYDIHNRFVDYAISTIADARLCALFKRMAQRSQIEHRYSVLSAADNENSLDGENFYQPNNFPDTAKRMDVYKKYAFALAQKALSKLKFEPKAVTHIVITSCTGFYAPGLDLEIINHYGMSPSVERNYIGFMGCYAAINSLKMARHIVRSQPKANVLVINLEFSTLHLQKTDDLEQLLTFLLFADGCAASIVSAHPAGIRMDSFHSVFIPNSLELITWHIGNQGFDMVLSGEVPATIISFIKNNLKAVLKQRSKEEITHWAIHPGGRSIINAVQKGIGLSDEDVSSSREILRNYGNMSSATIMFVLQKKLQSADGIGCAMSFGPGVMMEGMLFHVKS